MVYTSGKRSSMVPQESQTFKILEAPLLAHHLTFSSALALCGEDIAGSKQGKKHVF